LPAPEHQVWRDLSLRHRAIAVLFAGRCGPCVEDLIPGYERLHRRGFGAVVIALGTRAEIDQLARLRAWTLPIIVDDPDGYSGSWAGTPAPWMMIWEHGRVTFAQPLAEPGQSALDRVTALLSGTKAGNGREDSQEQ
jgi:hypothetical protein